jgi:hypothetical protein
VSPTFRRNISPSSGSKSETIKKSATSTRRDLKMEAVCSSETSESLWTVWRYNSEDGNIFNLQIVYLTARSKVLVEKSISALTYSINSRRFFTTFITRIRHWSLSYKPSSNFQTFRLWHRLVKIEVNWRFVNFTKVIYEGYACLAVMNWT